MDETLKEKNPDDQVLQADAQPAQEDAQEQQMQPMSEGDQANSPVAEDTQDDQEDKEEQKEQEDNSGSAGGDVPQPGEVPASDDINQEIADVAADAGMEENREGDQGDPDRPFDTLEDLKKLNGESGDENKEEGTNSDVAKIRKGVHQLRKGNLYKAVIFARMLESGANPASKEKELEARQSTASGGRFSRFLKASKLDKIGKVTDRFLNTSKLDSIGKVTKLTNAASGVLGMASSKYKKSKVSGLVSIANDVMILVNSIHGIMKKLRDLRKNIKSVTKTAFTAIGLVSDFGMAVAKGASLAQRITQRMGQGSLSKVFGYISDICAIVGQTAGLVNVSKTLAELVIGTKKIKKAQGEEEKEVLEILKKYGINVGPTDNAEQASQGEEKEGKRKRLKKKILWPLKKKKELKEKCLDALERQDISNKDKAVLASYLGRGRIISKRKLAIANVSTGLITATLGLGATVSKTAVDFTPNDEIETKKSAGLSAVILGGATNVSMLLSAAGTGIAGKVVNSGPGEREGNLIKEGLYGALRDLGDEKFGLRKIAAALTPENPEATHVGEADEAIKRYGTVSKQFAGSGVNFAKLFTADNLETFKNSLVASL